MNNFLNNYEKKINIITVDNQSGLTRDAQILSQILTAAGFEVTIFEVGKPTINHKIQKVTTYLNHSFSCILKKTPLYDVNLFLEYVFPSWFSYAKVNCLIPNQEWFRDNDLSYLPQFDYIICKTKFAEDIFNKLGCKTVFTSFTSLDHFQAKYQQTYDKFLHVAGSNLQKVTQSIVNVWQRNPNFPELIILQNPQKAKNIQCSNIKHITRYISEKTLWEYQNTRSIHLCPSEAEGFGHYIVEAMSCKAVIITTNAPPMNELITPERGILVNYSDTKPQRLGINYYVDTQSLKQKIKEVLGMDYVKKKQLGENAREWYLNNDRFFKQRFIEIIKDM